MNDPAVVLALHSLLVDSSLTWVAYDNDHPMQQAYSILIQSESSYMRYHIVIAQTFTLHWTDNK